MAKAGDARLMLAAAAAGHPALRPAGAGDQPIRNVHTRLLDAWQHRFHGGEADGEWVADAEAVTAIQLAHPAFPDAYRRHVLARITGLDPGHAALVCRAAGIARERGLEVPEPGSDLADSWLTAADLTRDADDALATLLARSFGARPGQCGLTLASLPPSLRTPAVLAWGRDLALAARRRTEALLGSADGGPRRRFRSEVIDRTLAALWDCEISDLQAGAFDRGIADLSELRRLAEPFVAQLRPAAGRLCHHSAPAPMLRNPSCTRRFTSCTLSAVPLPGSRLPAVRALPSSSSIISRPQDPGTESSRFVLRTMNRSPNQPICSTFEGLRKTVVSSLTASRSSTSAI